ncbi:MAG: cyclophilin-like fold protein [Candidatus Omnitrophota bacterium]
MQVSFQTKDYCFLAELEQNKIAQEISKSLPLKSEVMLWGDEIYFKTCLALPEENLTSEVDVGDIAYWPEGQCICVFFGPTPVSKTDKPVPASPVAIIGKTLANPAELRKILEDSEITLSLVNDRKNEPKPDQQERKLTQPEIDLLVQQLLAQKAK